MMVKKSLMSSMLLIALMLPAGPGHAAGEDEQVILSLDKYPSGWVGWASAGDSVKPLFSVVKDGADGGECAQFVFPRTGRQCFGGKVLKALPPEVNAISFWARTLDKKVVSSQISISESRTAVKDGAEWFAAERTFSPNWTRMVIPLSEFKRKGAIGGPGNHRLDRDRLEAIKFNFFQHPESFTVQIDALQLLRLREPSAPPPPQGNRFTFDTDFESSPGALLFYSTPNLHFPERDPGRAYHGRCSLRIPGDRLSWLRCADWVTLRKNVSYTLSFYARAAAEKVPFAVACFSRHWKGCGSKTFTLGPQWRRCEMSVTAGEDGPAFLAFGLNPPDGQDLWLDCLQFEEGKATPYADRGIYADITTGQPGETVVADGAPLPLSLRVWRGNASPYRGKTVSLFVRCRDYDGQSVFERTLELPLDDRAASEATIASERPFQPGHYTVDLLMRDGSGAALASNQRAFAVVAPRVPLKNPPRLVFALNTGTADVPWEAMRRIGVRSLRTMAALSGVSWPKNPPPPGELARTRLTLPPALAQMKDVSIFAPIDLLQVPKWAFDKQLRIVQPQLYAEFFQAAVNSAQTVPTTFEIQNEPHLSVFKYQKREMAESARLYADVVNAVCRQLGGPAGIAALGVGIRDESLPYAARIMELAGKSFSIMPIHPYAGSRYIGPYAQNAVGPEQNKLYEGLFEYDDLIRKHGAGQELWLGEFGYAYDKDSSFDSPYPRETAVLMARTFIIAAATNTVKRMYWFLAANCGGPGEAGYYYGMWNLNAPMPAVPAYAFLSAQLENAKPEGGFARPYGVCAYAFAQPDGSAALFAWDWRRNELTVPFPAGELEVRDILGRPQRLKSKDGRDQIALSSSPLLLTSRKLSAPALLKRFEESLNRCVPVSIHVDTPDIATLRLTVTNNNDRPLAGELTVKMGASRSPVRLDLPARGTSVLSVRPAGGLPLKNGVMEVWFSDGSGQAQLVKTERLPEYVICTRGKGGPETTLKLGAAHVTPPDPIVGWEGDHDCSASAALEWDEQGLIFRAAVRDDRHCNDKAPGELWSGDSIQLAFDTRNDASLLSSGYDANDYEYGIALGPGGKTTRCCWFAPPGADKSRLAESLDAEVRRDGTVTHYRVRIPWSSLRPFSPAPGKVMGFSFIVNDNDGEKRRNYYLALTPGVSEKNPGYFRKLVLK